MSATLIFVDPAISHLDQLLGGLDAGAEAIVLDGATSAPAQIADALQGREPVSRVHVIAHGAAGEVSFASGTLSLDTLDSHDADLQRIKTTLRGGDILLWSCHTGEGARGAAFVDALAAATGSRVGASTRLVGSAARGGRWTLDHGNTEHSAPLSPEGQRAYEGIMIQPVGNTVTIIHLGNPQPTTFTTIQDAIDHAVAGDTIQIGGGTYTENVHVTKNNLTIQNAPGQAVTLIGTGGFGGAITVDLNVTHTNIRSDNDPTNFVIEGAPSGETAAVYLVGGNTGTSINSITAMASDIGAGGGHNAVLTGGNQNGLTFSSNVFAGNAAQLVYVNGAEDLGPQAQNGTINFVNNIFAGTAPLLLGLSAPGQVSGNTFSGTSSVALGLAESGVTVTGNTFSSTPSGQFIGANATYNPTALAGQNTFPDSHEVYIVHNGSPQGGLYSSIQAAIDDAQAGDTIVASAGTYSEHLNIDKAVTIEGANFGNDGRTVRLAETDLTGGVTISADGVTLDGVRVDGSYDSRTLDGTDLPNGVLVKGAHATIQNSIFSGDALDSRPFSAEGSASGLTFTRNLVTGWNEGAYIVEGASGSIANNAFTNDGNGVITESTAVDISHNSFSGSVGAEVVPIAFANESIGSFVHDNTYDQARPISVFAVGPAGQTITGSDISTTFHDEFHSGALTVQGGSGSDVYIANATDTIVEQANGGTDEVRATSSFTLPTNVENLTLLDGDSNTQTFDDMDLGPITDGENGWTVNGPNAPRDQEIVDVAGNHEFRMSSNPSIADFAGPFSPQLSVAAGEPDTGAAFSSQSIKFDIQAASATPDGSRLEIDFGNAAGTDRNNFMVIESFPGTGIRIAVSEPDTNGNFDGDGTDAAPNDWRQLVSGVDPSVSHSVELRLDYVDGANNDVIGVYLDGKEIGTTTTFENFHDALGGDHVTNAQANLTDRVFFRPSGNGAPQGAGVYQGFLIDNLTTAVYNNVNGTGNDLANVITANDGNDILTGLGGNDILHGGTGIDTAAYSGTQASYGVIWNGATVTVADNRAGSPDGTDTGDHISVLQFTDHNVFLVGGNSHFASIQDAIDAASAGDTILVAAGTYAEHLNVDKKLSPSRAPMPALPAPAPAAPRPTSSAGPPSQRMA